MNDMMKKFLLVTAVFGALTAPGAGSDYAGRVKRINDKVYIDRIPQVSQKRNFCAPASVSMILRYFDEKIPQNKLARLFDTSKKTGTSTRDIIEEFSRGELQDFSIRRLYALSAKEFAAMMESYGNSPKVSESKMRKLQKHGDEALAFVDPKIAVPVFSETRAELKKQMEAFFSQYIERGIPLLWAVEMNLDPDERMPGGHMRVLIGYARDKAGKIERVLYRDAWGKHKDVKEMPLADAVAMTYEILLILPKGIQETP